jgi:sarcosine reductase
VPRGGALSVHIVVYSKPACEPCDQVKHHLTKAGHKFELRDIGGSDEWRREVLALGSMSAPTTLIEKGPQRHVIVGFDPAALDSAIRAADEAPDEAPSPPDWGVASAGSAATLDVGTFDIRSVDWGATANLTDGVLTVSKEEVIELASDPDAFEALDVYLVNPGERVRILSVLDSVEPMLKVSGPATAYPGVMGPARTVGSGRTHRLSGMTVLTSGHFPKPPSGLHSVKHGFVDMFGAAADYCDASDTANLVLFARPRADISNQDFDSAVRGAAHRVASRLAELTRDNEPDSVETFHLGPTQGLPRVAYLLQLQDQGPLIRPLLYGHQLGEDFLPTLIHPNELLDGALVSANYRSSLKMSTRLHTRNPVLLELYRRHGRDLHFAGVIVSRGHHANHFLKERSANYAAKLAGLMGANAAVLSWEGTGNATIDYMLTIGALEQAGIRTAGILHELGGSQGSEFPIVDSVDEADALVSTGNADEAISVERPDRVLGPAPFMFYTGESADPLEVEQVSALECFCGLARMGVAGRTAVDY